MIDQRTDALQMNANAGADPPIKTVSGDGYQTAEDRQKMHSVSAVTRDLFGSAGVLDKPALSDSTWGRAIIRLVSRGVVGALFFTWGGSYASKKMLGYEPELWRATGGWKSNVLRTVAKCIDAGPGWVIKNAFNDPGAVRFRDRNQFHSADIATKFSASEYPSIYDNKGQPLRGRSLGAEIVMVTFDFFMASIGDALTRNIFQVLDPNVKHSWIVDRNGDPTVYGKGRFDFGIFLQKMGKIGWRIISKNAGEDWVAALPYVYQMKWQRDAISNIGERDDSFTRKYLGLDGRGFKRSSDSNINGAVVTLNENGEIGRSLQWAGALDLHWRFVGYNWYTLMYREAYDAIGRAWDRWSSNRFALAMPHIDNPLSSCLDALTGTVRYVVKSFIKANIYMQPAMFFFWPMRVSQTAWRGQFEMKLPDDRRPSDLQGSPYRRIRDNEVLSGPGGYPRARLIHDGLDSYWPPPSYHYGQEVFHGNPQPNNPNFFKNAASDPYQAGIQRGWFDTMINPLGNFSFASGTWLTRAIDKIAPTPGAITNWILKGTPDQNNPLLGREKFIRNAVDASYSYTPYMFMKAETALRVDDRHNSEKIGKMDQAIYNLMDNVSTMSFKNAWRDIKTIGHLSIHQEGEVINREGDEILKKMNNQGTGAPLTPANDVRPGHVIDASSVRSQSGKVQPARTSIDTPKENNDNFLISNDNSKKQWANAVNGSASHVTPLTRQK